MRSDQETINGLLAYKLRTTNTTTGTSKTLQDMADYLGIRVWKRSSGGVETEITDGNAQARALSPITPGIVSGTWACPQTALNPTDSIVVRVYQCSSTGGTQQLYATFTTEQLGAQSLDAVTWTVYYYAYRWRDPDTLIWYITFYWGSSTYNSRIANFTWTPAAVVAAPFGDGLVWITQEVRRWS